MMENQEINPPITQASSGPKLVYVLIVILILGLGGIGGYLLGTKKTPAPEPTKVPRAVTKYPSATTSNEISGGKTYKSITYGFEFQYPSNYVYKETGGELANFETTDGKGLGVALENSVFSVDYLRKYAPTGGESFNPELKMFGKNTFYYYGAGGGGVCYPDQYFTNLNNKILIFNFIGCDNDKTPSEKTKLIENQILSTFKFLPTTSVVSSPQASAGVDETVGWKTYTNTKYRYSINYPSNWTLNEKSDYQALALTTTTISSPDGNSLVDVWINNGDWTKIKQEAPSAGYKEYNLNQIVGVINQKTNQTFISLPSIIEGQIFQIVVIGEEKLILDKILSTFRFL